MTHSQNSEDLFILNYFAGKTGTLLDIGANDGITFSNSRLLIENGWNAHLVEPGIIADDLIHLYEGKNDNVQLYFHGIGSYTQRVKFWQSGAHVLGGEDSGLVSSTSEIEIERWKKNGVKFKETVIDVVSWIDFYNESGRPKFDFISIDAEGMDWQILQQINLDEVGCSVLCIEYNSDPNLFKLFTDYCKGFKVGLQNAENLVFVR